MRTCVVAKDDLPAF